MNVEKTVQDVQKVLGIIGQVIETASSAAPEVKMAIAVIQGFFSGVLTHPQDINLDKLEQGLKSLKRYDEYLEEEKDAE
jgi:hypothetical protein